MRGEDREEKNEGRASWQLCELANFFSSIWVVGEQLAVGREPLQRMKPQLK
jgi:hypothetical protein